MTTRLVRVWNAVALVLGWRRRRRTWWALLSVAVLTLPFSLVLAMARLDLWCYDRRSASARLIAGALMVALIGGAQLLRLWAWRITEPK